jgi:hypothetical protein
MADTAIDFGILAGAGAPVRDFNAGDVIFNQGDAATELFVVRSGKVEIRLGNRLLETVPDRGIFGEMALIDAAPRSAKVVAATDVKLVPDPRRRSDLHRRYREAHCGAADRPRLSESGRRPSAPADKPLRTPGADRISLGQDHRREPRKMAQPRAGVALPSPSGEERSTGSGLGARRRTSARAEGSLAIELPLDCISS